jgi:OTU domain-containing protein 6
MDELQQRHCKERRELQSRMTQKKKNATKKTRKGVNAECAELERQLAARQQDEVSALDPSSDAESATSEQDSSTPMASNPPTDLPSTTSPAPNTTSQPPPKKPNRQKARLARRAAEQEALVASAAAEAATLPDRRADERAIMQRETRQRGLEEREVRSDGHCLYAAVADQLDQLAQQGAEEKAPKNSVVDYIAVRRAAAAFIEEHREDFEPFLDESFDIYVRKIRDTAEWGGQLELLALAKAYGMKIHVLQGDGRVETIEREVEKDEERDREIWLAYYRHSFGLGEHYNSLRKKKAA